MPVTKRKNKRIKKKKFAQIFLIGSILLLVGAILAYYRYTSKSPLFISPLSPNYKIESEDRSKNLEILKKQLKEKNIKFEKVLAMNGYFLIKLEDKSEIIFSKEKDVPSQIASLQFILTRLTMEGKAFRLLDLRFDKPVLRE